MSDRFGVLRSLLQATPSVDVWRALCEELALWGEEERERVALPYALDHLDKWPPKIERTALEEFELWQRTGVVTPVLRLINAVWLNHPRQLKPLRRSPLAGWVRHVELWIGVIEEETLGARLAGELGELGLVSLWLSEPGEAEGVAALLRGLDMPGLRTLRFADCEPHGDAIAAALAENTALPALREVELPTAELSAAGARSLARMGRLERLVVDGNPLGYRGAVALAGLALRSLSAALCGFGPQSVVALARGAGAASWERLVLDRNKIGAVGARALAELPHPTRLTTLSLHDAGLRADDLRLLAGSPAMAALEELEVSMNQTAGAAVAIFEGLRALRKLSMWDRDIEIDAALAGELAARWPPALEWPFSSCKFAEGALAALADCEGLVNTRRLLMFKPDAALLASPRLVNLYDLTLCRADAATLDALERNEALGALRRLDIRRPTGSVAALLAAREVERLRLTEVTLDAACVDALCAMGLRELWLSSCVIEPAQLRRLLGSAGLEGLEELSLFRTLCDDASAAVLAQNPALSGLRELKLRDEPVGDAGVRALVGSPYLSGLRCLHLDHNQLGDVGAAALANSPLMTRLVGYNGELIEEQGVLMGNQIGDAGLFALMRSPYLGLMHNLDLRNNPISEEAMRALASDPALAKLAGTLRLSGDPEGEAGQALEESALLGRGAWVRVEAPEDPEAGDES